MLLWVGGCCKLRGRLNPGSQVMEKLLENGVNGGAERMILRDSGGVQRRGGAGRRYGAL